MYEELLKQLKDKAGGFEYDGWVDTAILLGQAADAIEELSKLAEAIPHKCKCCIGCEIEQGNGGCGTDFVLSPERAKAFVEENLDWWRKFRGLMDVMGTPTAEHYKAMIPRWIPVTERLPEEWKSVLTYQPYVGDEEKPLMRISWYIGAGSWRECERADKLELPVTHWMPLPSTEGLNET